MFVKYIIFFYLFFFHFSQLRLQLFLSVSFCYVAQVVQLFFFKYFVFIRISFGYLNVSVYLQNHFYSIVESSYFLQFNLVQHKSKVEIKIFTHTLFYHIAMCIELFVLNSNIFKCSFANHNFLMDSSDNGHSFFVQDFFHFLFIAIRPIKSQHSYIFMGKLHVKNIPDTSIPSFISFWPLVSLIFMPHLTSLD